MAASVIDSYANYHAISTIQDSHNAGADSTGDEPGNLETAEQWNSESETLTRWTYFLLGCATLLPWNASICGMPFFSSRLANSKFYSTFNSYLTSAYTWTKLLCTIYCTITAKQSSPSRRIFTSIIVATLLVTSLCFSTFIRGTPSTFYPFVLINTACLAAACSYLCSAVYARAALLGSTFLQSVLSGQAAITVIINAVQVVSAIISIWGWSKSVIPTATIKVERTSDNGYYEAAEISARIFFAVSALFLVMTLVAYAWLTRRKSAISNVKQHCNAQAEDMADELTGLVTGNRTVQTEAISHLYRVFKQNWVFMFSVEHIYAATLAVYPAITARVQSVYPSIPPLLFTAVHFLVFNIGDFIGRYTCSFPRLVVWSANKILVMSFLRMLFIPLILLCNFHRPETTSPASLIVNSDTLFFIILIAMGYTNGFLACSAILAVSSLEHNPNLRGRREDVDVAAMLASTLTMVGLASGALFSFGVQAML